MQAQWNTCLPRPSRACMVSKATFGLVASSFTFYYLVSEDYLFFAYFLLSFFFSKNTRWFSCTCTQDCSPLPMQRPFSRPALFPLMTRLSSTLVTAQKIWFVVFFVLFFFTHTWVHVEVNQKYSYYYCFSGMQISRMLDKNYKTRFTAQQVI